jgi:DNA-binding transcriptional regulator/RsmH inhibitor MraZ
MHTTNKLIQRGNYMTNMDEVLWVLKDGEWHNIAEVMKEVAIPQIKLEKIVSFLQEYSFIQLTNDGRVRIQPSIRQFLEEIQRLEKEEQAK